MSDSRVNEQTVRRRFPYPIAAAWHRVSLVTGDAERIRILVACNEVVLRTLASFLLPDYLRGEQAPAVETVIRKLTRPTDGIWVELVRETIRHLAQRRDPPPFMPEASAWFFDAHGRVAEGGRDLETVVALRNQLMHAGPPVSTTQVEHQVKELREATWHVLQGLGWLTGYRPFRVRSQETVRRRGTGGAIENLFAGRVQMFTGTAEQSEPQVAEWDAFLSPDATYLIGPDASAVLELQPFLEVLPDPHTNQDHLYLIRSSPGMKRVLRAHDESSTELTKAVRSADGEVSFDGWLGMRDQLEPLLPLRIAGGALRLAREERLEVGELGPRYEMLEVLGRGGMAVVYRVFDLDLEEEAALKVLNRELAEEESYRERFRREARRMKRIYHPRIVTASDLGTLPSGQPFLKMPVMRHGSLQEKVGKEGQPEETVMRWAEDALQALECIHRLDIVHRDLKPSNFLLDDGDHACLTDFGIALTAEDVRLTRTLEQLGTLAYMAPEQRTQKTVTAKADVYSLAVVLHELRTGELPRTAPGAGLAGELGRLIRSMGEADSDQRPTSTAALERLRTALALPLPQSPPPPPPPLWRQTETSPVEPSRPPGADTTKATETRPPDLPVKLPPPPVAVPHAGRIRLAAVAALLALFAFNYAETAVESSLRGRLGLGIALEQWLGEAAQWLEGGLSFDQHDTLKGFPVYGFSSVYFFVFPLIASAVVAVAFRRRDPRPLLLLAAAATIDYLLTLPFYLFLPVPERWTYPDSGAVLLSDLWTSTLIQAFRPFSGLNNCFPSFHVSSTVLLVACLFNSGSRLRLLALPLGAAVMVSTFALGIHWLSDIIAGIGCGLVSYALAKRFLPRIQAAIAGTGQINQRG